MDTALIYKKRAFEILSFIERHDHFILSAHINADGDAYASMIAVHLLLSALKKNSAMILTDSKTVSRYDFLKNFKNILHYSDQLNLSPFFPEGKAQAAIILDVPSYDRLGEVRRLLPEAEHVVKIDHHPIEDNFGGIDWVDTKASSTTSMVYELYRQSAVPIDLDMARALYTGILYDTGRFSYSNTTARDYSIAAEMLKIGVRPAEITSRIFFENSFKALKTIGKGLFSLERHLDGLVNSIYLSFNDLVGQEQSEIEELANLSVSIKGGDAGLFIREIKTNFHKVSLRSKEIIDVNQVAKAFGGGGHKRAAGCRIPGSRQEVITLLLNEIQKQL